ncbi:hypothetical protein BHE74_00002921 [Ensete ventricosum]|nr:hypothetical protein BHE74_00002921 [Ensete ventricosum]
MEAERRRLRKAHTGFDYAPGSTRHVESRQWWIRFYSARRQAGDGLSTLWPFPTNALGSHRVVPQSFSSASPTPHPTPRPRDPTCGSDASGQRDRVGGQKKGAVNRDAFLPSERTTKNSRIYQYVDWGKNGTTVGPPGG